MRMSKPSMPRRKVTVSTGGPSKPTRVTVKTGGPSKPTRAPGKVVKTGGRTPASKVASPGRNRQRLADMDTLSLTPRKFRDRARTQRRK